MLLIKIVSISEHCRMHHKWLCEKRDVLCFIFSPRIILWLFLLLFLIHCQSKTKKQNEKGNEREREKFIYSNYSILCANCVFIILKKKLLRTFFGLSPCLYIFDGEKDPSLQAYSPKCQRNISSYFQKVFLYFYHLNPLLEGEWE